MPRYRDVSYALFPPLTPMVKKIVIFTSAAFVVTWIPARFWGWGYPYGVFALRPWDVTHNLFVWQLVTYLFLHAEPFHIIFNMFGVWMFGSDLERLWGPRKFLFYYFLTGIGAGILDVVVHPSALTATIGCSGAFYGLLVAFGLLFPERIVLFALIIPMRAKWFVLIFAGIEFLYSLSTPGSTISHVAHVGGMLFGLAYLRGGGLRYRLELRYQEWRRARLRRKFEVYMHKHEKKDEAGRWIN